MSWPVCLNTKTLSCIPKKKLKLCICVWTSMTWLRALESALFFKLLPATLETQLNYLNCFVTVPLWQSNNLGMILCHQSFQLHCLSLTCWKLLLFLESICFFSYDFKNTAFDYFSQFKCCIKRASNYFYCFNGITIN